MEFWHSFDTVCPALSLPPALCLRKWFRIKEAKPVGAWRSLVAHLPWAQGVASSNLAAPTTQSGSTTPGSSDGAPWVRVSSCSAFPFPRRYLKLPKRAACRNPQAAPYPAKSHCLGRITASMTWMTPFEVSMSGFTTVALSTKTLPSRVRMLTLWPLSVFAERNLTTCDDITFPPTT